MGKRRRRRKVLSVLKRRRNGENVLGNNFRLSRFQEKKGRKYEKNRVLISVYTNEKERKMEENIRLSKNIKRNKQFSASMCLDFRFQEENAETHLKFRLAFDKRRILAYTNLTENAPKCQKEFRPSPLTHLPKPATPPMKHPTFGHYLQTLPTTNSN